MNVVNVNGIGMPIHDAWCVISVGEAHQPAKVYSIPGPLSVGIYPMHASGLKIERQILHKQISEVNSTVFGKYRIKPVHVVLALPAARPALLPRDVHQGLIQNKYS